MHVRGIVITCDILIQSERVNMILKYREYRATSTVTEPILVLTRCREYLLFIEYGLLKFLQSARLL